MSMVETWIFQADRPVIVDLSSPSPEQTCHSSSHQKEAKDDQKLRRYFHLARLDLRPKNPEAVGSYSGNIFIFSIFFLRDSPVVPSACPISCLRSFCFGWIWCAIPFQILPNYTIFDHTNIIDSFASQFLLVCTFVLLFLRQCYMFLTSHSRQSSWLKLYSRVSLLDQLCTYFREMYTVCMAPNTMTTLTDIFASGNCSENCRGDRCFPEGWPEAGQCCSLGEKGAGPQLWMSCLNYYTVNSL